MRKRVSPNGSWCKCSELRKFFWILDGNSTRKILLPSKFVPSPQTNSNVSPPAHTRTHTGRHPARSRILALVNRFSPYPRDVLVAVPPGWLATVRSTDSGAVHYSVSGEVRPSGRSWTIFSNNTKTLLVLLRNCERLAKVLWKCEILRHNNYRVSKNPF